MNDKTTNTPWGEVGYATYKRTYSRPIEGGTEEWEDTVDRVIGDQKLHDEPEGYGGW